MLRELRKMFGRVCSYPDCWMLQSSLWIVTLVAFEAFAVGQTVPTSKVSADPASAACIVANPAGDTMSAGDALPTVAADGPAAIHPSKDISFDVVSIKPVGVIRRYGVSNPPDGDGLEIYALTSLDIVQWAFHLVNEWRNSQFEGAPKWFDTDRYEIRAKVAASDVEAWHKLSTGERRYVLRKVLVDRFHLSCHFAVVQDQPVYNLVIAKDGLKIKEAKPDEISPWKFHVAGDPSTSYSGPGLTVRDTPDGPLRVFQRLDMRSLVNSGFFTSLVDRPVIDKTGLTGVYNYSLRFNGTPPAASPISSTENGEAETNGPDIFTALQKQLGLKLEAGRGPVLHFVIDHIEKPSAD